MAKRVIGIGTIADDGSGDPLRTAMSKINDNFTELYNADTALDGAKEPTLGVPNVSGYILSSTTAGVRSWIPAPVGGGGGVSSVAGSGAISVATGTTTAVVSIAAATTGAAGTMSAADKSKLDTVVSSPQARANHTGTQAQSTIDGLVTALAGKEPTLPANTGGNGYVLSSTTAGVKSWVAAAPGGSAHVIKDDGVTIGVQRAGLNFTGAGVTVTDDGASNTVVNIPAAVAGSGHAIEDEGVARTARGTLNFTGAGVTVTDDGTKTVVSIPAAAGVGTDITQGTRTATTVPVNSSSGTGASLAGASSTLAGVMVAVDKVKLDALPTNAVLQASLLDPMAERTAAGVLVFPARYNVSWTRNANNTLNVGTCTDGVTTWTMTYAYNASGNIATMTAFNGTTTWVNTPTYVGGVLTTLSGWI